MNKHVISEELDQLVRNFLECGGKITKGKSGRRNALNSSWNGIRADVAYRGSKARSLRNEGYAKAVG